MIDSIERSDIEYLEQLTEISIFLGNELGKTFMHPKLEAHYFESGRGGVYELAQDMADKFYKLHEYTVWGDEDFFETMDEYCQNYLDNL